MSLSRASTRGSYSRIEGVTKAVAIYFLVAINKLADTKEYRLWCEAVYASAKNLRCYGSDGCRRRGSRSRRVDGGGGARWTRQS